MNFKPVIREIVKRYGKLRGYKFKSFGKKPVTLSLENIDKKFESGERVSPQTLMEKGLIRKIKGEIPKIKILSDGEIKKVLIFEKCLFSKSAKEKIEKAGGDIK
jgi:large subunit ribosomal protein L15